MFKSYFKLAIILQLTLVFIVSCNKADDPTTAELLKGVWINTHIDDAAVESDLMFVMEFVENTEYYSAGVVYDAQNREWIDRRAFNFSINADLISIDGTDALGNALVMEFEILSITKSELKYKVNSFSSNGVVIPDPKVYKMKKETIQLENLIVGTWYGKSTHAGSPDTDYHYWDYLADGTYDYYYRETPTSPWIKKIDNVSSYYLYDNLLVTNWSNDLISENMDLKYEVWEVELVNDTMKWTGLRAGGQITSNEMVKVAGPPTN